MKLRYRFPYAQENGACHDCGVLGGQWHHNGCDVERCPFTFNQRITCDCGKCKELRLVDKIPFGFELKEVRNVAQAQSIP